MKIKDKAQFLLSYSYTKCKWSKVSNKMGVIISSQINTSLTSNVKGSLGSTYSVYVYIVNIWLALELT